VRSSPKVATGAGGTRERDFLSRFDSCSRLSVMEEIFVPGADGLSQERLPRLLDIEGVAEHLGVSERHVRRLVAERRIPFVKWGHLLRFDPAEIASWLDSVRVPPAGGVARSR
jgi:excisionase family DNA binding protein